MPELNTLFLQKIIQDLKQTTAKTTEKTTAKTTEKTTAKNTEILLSSKIKRNISNENFIKFSWSWTM